MSLTKNKIQERLFQAINDSLALLNQASINEQKPAKIEVPIPSLLDQCIELCGQHKAQAKEPLRIIHHFGLPSGSPLLSSLATIPSTQVVKDVFANENKLKESIKSQVLVAKNSDNSVDEERRKGDVEYQHKAFVSDLLEIQEENNLIGQRLLICDNYCLSQAGSLDTNTLLVLLDSQVTVYSLIVVADPVDSYLAYFAESTENNVLILSFEEYCQCVFSFIKANPEMLIIHHKDFITKPEMVLGTMGNMLDLPICDDFLILRDIFSKSDIDIDDSLVDTLETSKPYKQLCELLGYQDRFDASASEKKNEESKVYSLKSDAYYKNKSRKCVKKEDPPFILLDSKSIPRSGLHYMKRTFEQVLGNNFSFCEWYQEHGCCKKMPCELTGFATHSKGLGEAKLRLIKSHDFELSDPDFIPSFSARRIILIREPLYVLTSLFLLEQLGRYRKDLKSEGVNIEKIFLSHEPEVLTMGFDILDKVFIGLSPQELAEWLDKKVKYLNDFIEKWVDPINENIHQYKKVVRYEKINEFIEGVLLEMYDYLPHEKQRNINEYIDNNRNNFSVRNEPFNVTSKKVSGYLLNNSDAFRNAASQVKY